MPETNIQFKTLTLADLTLNCLSHFNRFQETTRVWYPNKQPLRNYPRGATLASCYQLKEIYFRDEWDNAKKAKVITSLRQAITSGGFAIGGYDNTDLVAFASINGERFGSQKQYQEMVYFHVSSNYRGHGIGRRLFQLCVEQSRKQGVAKLYLSTHPSLESQAFYAVMGCQLAQEIDTKIYSREPLDIQLEYVIFE